MSFDAARALADAVLFEGYALYPYRASAPKNRLRWQFGVLAPRAWSEAGGGDAWWQETQCLFEPAGVETTIRGRLRFLQVRRPEASGPDAPAPWDEGETREIDFELPVRGLVAARPTASESIPFEVPGASANGRRSWPLRGALRLTLQLAAAARPLVRLQIRVENLAGAPGPGAPRTDALRFSLLGTHVMLAISGGSFVSLLDPPAFAADAAARCRSTRTHPVLAGPAGRRDLVLSAPVILPDHAAVAPESARDLFDATEIDEILTLRILTLTDEEKREARATDPRVAALIDHVERMGPDELSRLHGAIRELRPLGDPAPLEVGGVAVGPGTRVVLRPGARRTDAQDMFLDGMTATVREVMRDTEDRVCLSVTLDDDPATDLLAAHGRFRYFYPDEIEPVAATAPPEAQHAG